MSYSGTNYDFSDTTVYSNANSNDGGHSHDISTTASTTGTYGKSANTITSVPTLPPYFTVFA